MMTLLIPDTQNDHSFAYLIDRSSLIKCHGSTQDAQNLLQLNFNNLQPVKNAHGSLIRMTPVGWQKYARVMGAKYSKESSDLIFWTTPGKHQ